MDATKRHHEAMRLNNQEINNLAVYTGVNTDALRRFIGKYNLDVAKLERNVMKYKRVRLDLAAAITGYENNELALDFAAKYRLDESTISFIGLQNAYTALKESPCLVNELDCLPMIKQYLVFENGKYRTSQQSILGALILKNKKELQNYKIEKGDISVALSTWAPRVGLEPTT
jgi:hypothetical protein